MPPSLIQRRFHAQHLSATSLRTPAEVVDLLCAVQSQDYLGAKWSVGQRITNGLDADIDRAMAEGSILRTHILRPTWHFVTPKDIGWLLELSAPQVLRLNSYQLKELELDAKKLSKMLTIIAKGVEGRRYQTRDELCDLLARHRIDARGRRMAYLMMQAELTGLVCSGALKGKQQSYALLSERAPKRRELGREEGVAELLRRFLTGHTPATLKHFGWWSGISVKESKRALEEVRREFEVEVIDGVEWFGAPRKGRAGVTTRAWFIPEYDEALVGSPDMGVPRMMTDRRLGKVPNRYDRPVFLGGKWVGTWKREFEGRGATLEAALFGKVSVAEERALEKEAKSYGRFLGVPVRLVWNK